MYKEASFFLFSKFYYYLYHITMFSKLLLCNEGVINQKKRLWLGTFRVRVILYRIRENTGWRRRVTWLCSFFPAATTPPLFVLLNLK